MLKFNKTSLIGVLLLSCLLTLTSNGAAKEIDKNTMALWAFDESKGNIIPDLSERGHNLEIEGKFKWVKGKLGSALWFSENAFVEYKTHPDFSFDNDMSFEFWINIEAITPQTVVGIPRKESEYVSAFRQEPNGWWVDSYINNGAWVKTTSKPISKYGEWHHYATTFDGKEVKIYIDGKQTAVGVAPGPMNKVGDPFRISNSCCGGRFFVGAIDEMRVSNIPRTEEEIQEFMNIGVKGLLAVTPEKKLAQTWAKIKAH